MNTKRFFLGMAGMIAIMAMFTACSQNEAEDIAPISKSNVISLTSSMETMRAASELQTNELSTSVKVGAFGVSGSATITNGNNNEYTVGSTGTLTATNEMAWPSDASAKVSIYAYAPYQSGWSYNSANAFSVKTDQSSDANYLASDLLYAKVTDKSQTTEAIALNFTHQLSRINVTIKKGDGASALNGAKVYITNTYTATTLNPSTGALATTPSTVADILIGTLSAEPTAAGTTLYGITIPQDIAASTKLVKVTTSDKVYVAKLGNATTLEGGKSYNFTATVGTSTEVTLTLGSVTLTGWGDSNNLGSATMEEDVPDPIYATFGTPGGNASYDTTSFTYSCTQSYSNLMNCFTFSNGELVNYSKLVFVISELSGNVRINFCYGTGSSDNLNISSDKNGSNAMFGSNGTKTITMEYVTTALATVNKTLADVTSIRFGGAATTASCVIKASEMYLE